MPKSHNKTKWYYHEHVLTSFTADASYEMDVIKDDVIVYPQFIDNTGKKTKSYFFYNLYRAQGEWSQGCNDNLISSLCNS